ncbi:MAG: oxidoreductase [Ketobacteraceae bacterium]|nr:oxidoreductase [Ketobacteraceae bacterium]
MGWELDSIKDQTGKRVLITGANSGIGFEAARVLAGKGAEVILACRNPEKGESALADIRQDYPQSQVSLMTLDLASLASIEQFANDFKTRYDRLDILINNAGVMAPPFTRTADGFELQFGTNHLGHFALTGHLLPLLEAADAGRIVVVSSLAHRFGKLSFSNLNGEKRYLRWPAYAQSKLANLVFAQELQRRLDQAGSSVIAVAVHPGYSATNLQRHTPGGALMNKIAQSQLEGAMPTLYAATEPGISGGEYIGPDGWLEIKGRPRKARVAAKARDPQTAARLWDVSESLTQVQYLSA